MLIKSMTPRSHNVRRQRLGQFTATTMSLTKTLLVVVVAITAAITDADAQQTTVDSISGSPTDQHAAFSNYLLFSAAPTVDQNDASQQQRDLSRNLSNLLKDKNHNHNNNDVDIRVANFAWRKLHNNAREFARQRVKLGRPILNRLIKQANTSALCEQSINDVLDHLERMDDWAVRMYNSFGDFLPSGFFEGTWNSIGDYYQCVNLEANKWIGKPRFCTFRFQPIVPKRPRFHSILAKVDNLANFTQKEDMFNAVAEKAHYFYYTRLNVATCMPSKCDKRDLDRIGETIALNSYLQFSGTRCQEKSEQFNPDGAEIFAMIVLISLASVSFLGTFIHMIDLRSFFVHDDGSSRRSRQQQQNNGNQAALMQQQESKAPILPTPVIQQRQQSQCGRLIVQIIDVFLHFSMITNGRKLFDTSTSRRDASSSEGGATRAVRDQQMLREIPVVDGGKNEGAGDAGDVDQNNQPANKQEAVSDIKVTACEDKLEDSAGNDRDSGRQSNEITCVHGMRFWTISWIIFGHTMLYTEWAGFGRAYQMEENITSFWLHPFLNASFSVDTFFLISGLLTTYVTWSVTRGQYRRFNKFAFLVSRYLRLTPQVLLMMLVFIVFPLVGEGPYWDGLIKRESVNCKRNWWVSALYLQSFYRTDQICNLVTWWLSIEMFFHVISIFIIIALLHSTKKGILVILVLGGGMTAVSCYMHYVNSYPPNMFPTLIQRYEIWDDIVLKYFWTPYPHAPAYFTGLLLGYVLYNRTIERLSSRQVKLGWSAFLVVFAVILFGTYEWNKNKPYGRVTAMIYFNMAQIFWPLAVAWAILACALGHGGWLNTVLSSPVFVPLGRATYMTYLSHMIIIMAYPARMNLLIEPSYTVFIYIYIADLVLSYVLGIILTLVYESPILHMQKILVTSMALRISPKKEKKGPRNNDNNLMVNDFNKINQNSADEQRG